MPDETTATATVTALNDAVEEDLALTGDDELCSGCGAELPATEINCPSCGQDVPARLRRMLAETAADELETFEVLLVTDAERLRDHLLRDLLGARLVVVDDPAVPLATVDKLVTPAATAGKTVRTWCTPTDHGRRIAREVARTLDPFLRSSVNAERVRHITDPAPDDWQPTLAPFRDLVSGARTTVPSGTKSPGVSSAAAQHLPPDFDTSPAELARRIIRTYGAELLIVDDGDFGTGYALDAETGLWHAGGDTWARWLVEIADHLTEDIIRAGLTGRALTTAVNHVHRLKRPGMVDQTRPMLRAMLRYLRDRQEPCADVTECRAEEIDADMRYIGTLSGVIDLHAGRLLDPEEGRKALVTTQAPVEFDPNATHPAVDKLFAHLDTEAVDWWWRVLGFHLLGAPSRRFYVAVGPPSGGKTTLANAITGTLGPYASRPADDALEARAGGSAGLSPELEAFTRPRRWAIIDEAPRMKIAAPLLKRLSGDADQTFRRLHQQLQTVPATATVLVICNPNSVPRLRLQDEAMVDRLRELPYPAVPEADRDPRFKEIVKTDDFRRAFLARLVKAAAAETPRVPPDDVPVVRAATNERVREDLGELGAFARRIVRGAGTLTVPDLWVAWCEHNDESVDEPEAGGIGKRRLSTLLREHVNGLPAPKSVNTAGGKKARGWRGWKLLTAEEAEAQREQEQEQLPNPRRLDVTATFYGEITAQRWYELSMPRQSSEPDEEFEQRRERWKAELGAGRRLTGFKLIRKRELDATYLTFFDDPNASPSATADEKRAAVLIRDDEGMQKDREYYRRMCHAYEQDGAVACGTVDSLPELSPTDWDKIHQRCLDVLKSLAQLPEFDPNVYLWKMKTVDQFLPVALAQTLPPNTVPVVPLHGQPYTMRLETDADGGGPLRIGRWIVCRLAAPSTEAGIRLWSLAIDYAWRRCPEPRPPHPLELLGARSGHGAA